MLDILGYLLAGGVVLFLPGIAWWAWFPEKDKDILECIAEITGLSIAISALVMLGFFLLNWRLTPIAVGLIYALLGALAGAGVLRKLARSKRDDGTTDANSANLEFAGALQIEDDETEETGESPGIEDAPPEMEDASSEIESISPKAGETPEGIAADHDRRGSSAGWIIRNVSLLVFFVLVVAWRFYQVRDLVLPAWVDPLHHTLIVRLLLENGGLPNSFRPYMPVTFSYHFAFHVVTAAFTFLARLPAAQAVLVVGQVLNALVVVSIYRLGTALWGDWRRAGVAALLAGFVFQMPGYYATWGRYTLLTGLVLLPLAMAVALDSVRQKYATQRLVKLALLTGGVLLSHYFAALLLALFLILLGLQVFIGDLRQGKRLRGSRWLPLSLAAIAGAVLASPWIVRLLGFNQEWVGVTAVSSAESMDSAFFPNYLSYLWRMMGPRRNYILLALALIGLVVALWRPKNRAFGLWALVLGLFSLPWGFHLSPFRPDHYVIVLFLPGSLLVSEFIFTAWERLQSGRFRTVGTVLAGAVVIGLLIWGLWETRFIINQTTVFTNQADLDAIEWLAENTPSEARFLTNVTHWQYKTYRGVDGGWWIMPLTKRETLLPPALYVMGERDYVEGINKYAEAASQLQECSPELWELVEEAGVTHIYLVEGRGSLQPQKLESCNGLSIVYAKGGVTIYEVRE